MLVANNAEGKVGSTISQQAAYNLIEKNIFDRLDPIPISRKEN